MCIRDRCNGRKEFHWRQNAQMRLCLYTHLLVWFTHQIYSFYFSLYNEEETHMPNLCNISDGVKSSQIELGYSTTIWDKSHSKDTYPWGAFHFLFHKSARNSSRMISLIRFSCYSREQYLWLVRFYTLRFGFTLLFTSVENKLFTKFCFNNYISTNSKIYYYVPR